MEASWRSWPPALQPLARAEGLDGAQEGGAESPLKQEGGGGACIYSPDLPAPTGSMSPSSLLWDLFFFCMMS